MYIKFHQVDAKTGISIKLETPLEGPTFPSIDGLMLIGPSVDFDIWYAEVPDTYIPDNVNLIFQLTKEELAQELSTKIEILKANQINALYQEEKDLRTQLFGKYHETATIAGIYKYDQAKALVADSTAEAIDIRSEATVREIDPVVLAQMIITHHEEFRATSSKLAGLRGKMMDRISGFSLDMEDPITSANSFEQDKEVVGTKVENNETVNVEVGVYTSSLVTRWVNLV